MTRPSIIEGLLAEILAEAGAGGIFGAAPEKIKRELTSVVKRDYGRVLRSLGRREVDEILKEAKKRVWPQLNRQAATLVPPKEFARRWAGLGVDFRMANWTWPEGLALVGVYIKKTEGLIERPVICVNTAHHPLMVGTAFAHEMGHHLTSQIFASSRQPAQFLAYTGYAEHLGDPAELAADILVSVAGYPQGAARKMLVQQRKAEKSQAGQSTGFEKVLEYLAVNYGLKFDKNLSAEKKLHCLAALVHFTKLRQALLDEYDI